MKLGLVLAGGGGKGGYEIGVWKYLREIGLDDKISVISGSSVGGLNAALIGLVDYEIAEYIWKNEIENNILDSKSKKNKNGAIFSRNGLIKIIEKYIDLEKIKTLSKTIYVTCFKVATIETESFCLNNYEKPDIIKMLCATSAIPVAFQKEKLFGNEYVDGGLKDNVPLKPLIKEKCTHALIVNLSDDYEDYSGFDIKTVVIHPSSDLGDFISGTMDFSIDRSIARINLGYTDCRNIYSLQIKKLLGDNMSDNKKIEMATKINEMNDNNIMLETLKKICINKDDVKKLSIDPIFIQVPGNVQMKDLSEFGGWKFQEHTLFHYVRIIDELNNCRAWGNKQKMISLCKNYLINELHKK